MAHPLLRETTDMSIELAMFALGLITGAMAANAVHLWNLRRLALKNQKVWHTYMERLEEE